LADLEEGAFEDALAAPLGDLVDHSRLEGGDDLPGGGGGRRGAGDLAVELEETAFEGGTFGAPLGVLGLHGRGEGGDGGRSDGTSWKATSSVPALVPAEGEAGPVTAAAAVGGGEELVERRRGKVSAPGDGAAGRVSRGGAAGVLGSGCQQREGGEGRRGEQRRLGRDHVDEEDRKPREGERERDRRRAVPGRREMARAAVRKSPIWDDVGVSGAMRRR
jgi:hypothetical protein